MHKDFDLWDEIYILPFCTTLASECSACDTLPNNKCRWLSAFGDINAEDTHVRSIYGGGGPFGHFTDDSSDLALRAKMNWT